MNRSYLELTENFSTAVTSEYFRAEFTQYATGGSRIVELDGYADLHPVPLPGCVFLIASGLLILVIKRVSIKGSNQGVRVLEKLSKSNQGVRVLEKLSK